MGNQSKSVGFGRSACWRREFDDAIEAGLEDVRRGRVVSHEAMLAHRAEQRRKAGRA
jgi:predicted transcriptional regulator